MQEVALFGFDTGNGTYLTGSRWTSSGFDYDSVDPRYGIRRKDYTGIHLLTSCYESSTVGIANIGIMCHAAAATGV